jgi:hypothetical protein
VYLDESAHGGGYGPLCCACKLPIFPGQRTTRVEFNTDPDGAEGLTGDYHLACAKPYASLARIINLDLRR